MTKVDTKNPKLDANAFLNSALYVGYKDNVVSIGMGVWQPGEYTKEYNRTF